MHLYRIVIAILLTTFLACSSSLNGQFNSLANQGLLPLSSDSAFLGANLFLSDEFTKSDHLFNFLKGRGGPNAISIETNSVDHPVMKLYYPMQKEYYVSDLNITETEYQWVTRGPYRIDRKDYRELAGLFSTGTEEPAFQLRGQPFRFRPTAAEIIASRPVPTPTPRPTPKAKTKPGTIKTKLTEEQKVPPTPTVFQPLTFDQQALAMAQGFAERAPNGDVIHSVKKDSESIESIAGWYTGTPANAKELLKLNGLAEGAKMTPGMRIQIPKALVKQFKAM